MRVVQDFELFVRLFIRIFFLGTLSAVVDRYPRLFEAGDEQLDKVEVSPFAWLELVDKMANRDRTKWEFFLDMPLIEFFNAIAYHKAQTQERNKRLEQSANKGFQPYVIAVLNEML